MFKLNNRKLNRGLQSSALSRKIVTLIQIINRILLHLIINP